jgi:prepilin-type N-terminal cleavage/methylation domain-containing protein
VKALLRRVSRRAAGTDDGGFTLVEVLVALVILVLVFGSTAVVMIKAAKGSVVARQHQAAVALAAQQVERVRALSNAAVVAGSTSAITADSAVTTTSGVSYYNKEALALNSDPASGTNPLNTYPWPTSTSNNTKFTVKTFVTCKHTAFTGTGNGPACGTTINASDTILYHLTVLVTWTDSLGSRSFNDSSYLFKASPTNTCQPNLPIAAPCQAVQSAAAGTGKVNITLTPADQTTGGIAGVALSSASLAPGDADAAINAARTTTINSDANGGAGSWNAGSAADSIGGTTSSSAATNDPDSGATVGPTGTLSQAAISQTYASATGGNSLTLTQDAVTGSAIATSSAATTPICTDAGVVGSPIQQTNALPCADGVVKLGGVHATISATDSPASLGSWSILDLASASTASTVWTGQMASAFNGHCSSPVTDGCISAAADRNLGTLSLGALPSSLTAANSKWDKTNNYLVKLTGYSDSATSETGVTASSVTAPAAAGTLSYWNGSGYSSTSALTSGSSIPLSFSATSGGVTVTETGTITKGSVASTTGIGACSSGCTASAAVHGLIVDLTYTITVSGATVVSLQLHVDLGGVTTSATYQASPSAS